MLIDTLSDVLLRSLFFRVNRDVRQYRIEQARTHDKKISAISRERMLKLLENTAICEEGVTLQSCQVFILWAETSRPLEVRLSLFYNKCGKFVDPLEAVRYI